MFVATALLTAIPEEARGAPLAHYCHSERGATLDRMIQSARPEALWPHSNNRGSADSHLTALASMPGGPSHCEAPSRCRLLLQFATLAEFVTASALR